MCVLHCRFWTVSEDYRTSDWDAGWISQRRGKRKKDGKQALKLEVSLLLTVFHLYRNAFLFKILSGFWACNVPLAPYYCLSYKAIGAKFLLNSMRRQREAKTQQLQALIAEKKMELERQVSAHTVSLALRCIWNSYHIQLLQMSVPTFLVCMFQVVYRVWRSA